MFIWPEGVGGTETLVECLLQDPPKKAHILSPASQGPPGESFVRGLVMFLHVEEFLFEAKRKGQKLSTASNGGMGAAYEMAEPSS